MRGPAVRGVVGATLVTALLSPVVAVADKTVEASPPNRFSQTSVTMDQGEPLTFRNNDTVSHDVRATADGPDGKPLFATPIVAAGKSAFVEGSQYLTEGSYPFICSLHPSMKGTLHVSANGTPKPRPGTAPSEEPAVADKTRPKLGLLIASRTTQVARVRGTLVVRVSLDETSRLELKAIARPERGGPLVTIAKRVLRKASGVRRVQLELTDAGRAALRRDRSLAVIVKGTAIDRAGNKAKAMHGRTLAG